MSVSNVQEKAFSFDKKLSELEYSNETCKEQVRNSLFDEVRMLKDEVAMDQQSTSTRVLMLERITESMVQKIDVSATMVEGHPKLPPTIFSYCI